MGFATRHSKAGNHGNNRVCFTTFDLVHDLPKVCGVCASNPPIFRYAFSDDEDPRAEYMKGFCCGFCAVKLLNVLEHVESQPLARGTSHPPLC